MNLLRYARQLHFQKDLAKVRRETKSISIKGDVKNVEHLKDLPNLREVYLVTTKQEQFDRIIPHLKHITYLKMYEIRCTNLSALGTLTALEKLDLEWNTRIEKLWDMSELTSLKSLHVSGFSKLHDVTSIADVPWLINLELCGGMWNVLSLDTVKPLAGLVGLEKLNLANVKIQDASSIVPLGNLKALKRLVIPMYFPTEEIARLSVELPNTKCDVFCPYIGVALGDGKDIMIVGKGKPRLNSKKDAKRIAKYADEFRAFQDEYSAIYKQSIMEDAIMQFKRYAAELKDLSSVSAIHEQDGKREAWVYSSTLPNSLTVTLYRYRWEHGSQIVGIEVEGVDCGYWHTGEAEALDYHIELAKAALAGDVARNISPTMRYKEICFKVNDKWECTRVASASEKTFHYITTRRRIKGDDILGL